MVEDKLFDVAEPEAPIASLALTAAVSPRPDFRVLTGDVFGDKLLPWAETPIYLLT